MCLQKIILLKKGCKMVIRSFGASLKWCPRRPLKSSYLSARPVSSLCSTAIEMFLWHVVRNAIPYKLFYLSGFVFYINRTYNRGFLLLRNNSIFQLSLIITCIVDIISGIIILISFTLMLVSSYALLIFNTLRMCFIFWKIIQK